MVDGAGLACGFGACDFWAVALPVVDWAVLARDFGAFGFGAATLRVVDWAVLACVVLVALLLAAADDWAVLVRDFGAGFLDAD